MVMLVAAFVAFVGIATVESVALKGEQIHCAKGRAHVIRYDVEGEPTNGSSLESVRRAIVSVDPAPLHASKCETKNAKFNPTGDKKVCYGVNEDDSCTAARADIPVKDGIDCKDCFGSVSADVFYKLDYSAMHLNSVEVGLRDINLRVSASLHTNLQGSAEPLSGSIKVPDSDNTMTIIDSLVGCPVCVKVTIKVALPTTVDYSLKLDGEAELQGGAMLDLNLGDNLVHYDADKGWSHETHSPSVTVTPLVMATAKATADLDINIKSSAQVNVDNIVWYHLNLDPTLNTKLKVEGSWNPLSHDVSMCIDGDASFNMNQEADLDWNLLVWHTKDHWGPTQLYSWSKPDIIHGCKTIKGPDAVLV